MNRGVVTLFVAVLVTVGTLPALGATTPAAPTEQTTPTIERTITLSLTPDNPGAVAVTVAFTIPDTVSQLTTQLPERSHSVNSETFTNPGNTTWQWEEGNDSTPTISYVLPANQTGVSHNPQTEGRYLFVDVGPWAIVQVPQMPIQWLRSGPEHTFESTVEIDGSGATGGEMAYLGPYTTHTRTAHDQTVRLIVPSMTSLADTPTAILNTILDASDTLRVGERDDSIIFIAAPDTVDWGARGLSGGSDAWVLGPEPIDVPDNAWIHEYVHTRQSFHTTASTQWLTEAMATYYAAFLSLNQGLIQFPAFRDHLARGTDSPYSGSILADPQSWAPGTNYIKGALVWGVFDYELRQSTDSQHAATDLFRRLNSESEPVSGDAFLELVRAVGGPSAREFMAYYTTEPESPAMWSWNQHQQVFDTEPPRMIVTVDTEAIELSGPYRAVTGLPATVVVGETVQVPVTVRNDGEVRGDYDVTLTVDGQPIATEIVFVDPGETVTVTLDWTVASTGDHTLRVADTTFEVQAAEPATPTVTTLSPNRTRIESGESIAFNVTLENTADRPSGAVSVLVDDDTVESLVTPLAPGEQTTDTVVLTFSEGGDHTVTIGNRSVTVTVGDTPAQPGFGVATTALTLVTILVGLGLYRRYGR